jgi:hypothetical protein
LRYGMRVPYLGWALNHWNAPPLWEYRSFDFHILMMCLDRHRSVSNYDSYRLSKSYHTVLSLTAGALTSQMQIKASVNEDKEGG